MDGPNINWKFHGDLTQQWTTEDLPDLLNIGSCGLHIVHGALQKGEKDASWHLGNILKSLY